MTDLQTATHADESAPARTGAPPRARREPHRGGAHPTTRRGGVREERR